MTTRIRMRANPNADGSYTAAIRITGVEDAAPHEDLYALVTVPRDATPDMVVEAVAKGFSTLLLFVDITARKKPQ